MHRLQQRLEVAELLLVGERLDLQLLFLLLASGYSGSLQQGTPSELRARGPAEVRVEAGLGAVDVEVLDAQPRRRREVVKRCEAAHRRRRLDDLVHARHRGVARAVGRFDLALVPEQVFHAVPDALAIGGLDLADLPALRDAVGEVEAAVRVGRARHDWCAELGEARECALGCGGGRCRPPGLADMQTPQPPAGSSTTTRSLGSGRRFGFAEPRWIAHGDGVRATRHAGQCGAGLAASRAAAGVVGSLPTRAVAGRARWVELSLETRRPRGAPDERLQCGTGRGLSGNGDGAFSSRLQPGGPVAACAVRHAARRRSLSRRSSRPLPPGSVKRARIAAAAQGQIPDIIAFARLAAPRPTRAGVSPRQTGRYTKPAVTR